jgi:hypothetical protein
VRASPSSKAATLQKDSLALVHAVRAALDDGSLRGDTEVLSTLLLPLYCWSLSYCILYYFNIAFYVRVVF